MEERAPTGARSRTSSSTSRRTAPSVSAKTKAAIAAKRAAITKGTFYEFQGPIYDQAGKLRVPKGKKLSLGDILGMNWLVKGVIGSPKG